jgi:3'-5' exoribonuclease
VLDADVARTRAGALFHRMTLGDRNGGRLTARRFDVGIESAPAAGSVVRVSGVVERFNEHATLKLAACRADPDVVAADFFPAMPPGRAATLQDLDGLIADLGDPALRSWVERCFAGDVRPRLARHPAAVKHHHARVNGLLAHTVAVGRLARQLAAAVPEADSDVVLAAALLHDLGKLDELPSEPGAEPTDRGRLLGHVVLGLLHAAEVAARVPELDPERVDAVLHATAAAHGSLQHGAPVVPATLEAVLVHFADLIDARVEAALEAIEGTPAVEAWTAYLPAFGSRLRARRAGDRPR